MQPAKLHIVSFDIPDPPDYGGAIDVFYKVKNLAEAGAEIYLHCPEYGGRRHSSVLEAICKKVWYYPRNTGFKGASLTIPYTVYSRKNEELLRNMVSIDVPILFDGVSASYYLSHPRLKERIKILRNQNVEQDYYRALAKRERNIFRRLYYLTESRLLRSYENHLEAANAFFTVAWHDHEFFKAKYPKAVHEYIPSFQPYDKVISQRDSGKYAIYHGNLALAENKEAAMYLLKEVIPNSEMPFIITGRNPDRQVLELSGKLSNCTVIANPEMEEMTRLINEAHVQVLPTFQSTGLKLKLLHALFNGRHVIVNREMVHGTGLAEACIVANSKGEMVRLINELQNIPFTETAIRERERILLGHYNNKRNAQRIVTFLQQISP